MTELHANQKKHGAEKAPKRKTPDVISSQRVVLSPAVASGVVCAERRRCFLCPRRCEPCPAEARGGGWSGTCLYSFLCPRSSFPIYASHRPPLRPPDGTRACFVFVSMYEGAGHNPQTPPHNPVRGVETAAMCVCVCVCVCVRAPCARSIIYP